VLLMLALLPLLPIQPRPDPRALNTV